MNNKQYEKISTEFLLTKKSFRILNRENKLNKEQKIKIKNKIRALSCILLLNTPNNKHPMVLEHRKKMCLNYLKSH